jgi:phosphatidylserine decarboxylase
MRLESEPYIVKEGYPYVLLSGFVMIFFAMLEWTGIASIFFLVTMGIAAFFRNPVRRIPEDERAVVSPADGKVLSVEQLSHTDILAGPGWRICIFMSVFNVHVNRAPASGILIRKRYHPGTFFVASRDKASGNNERMELLIRADEGYTLGMFQIAGWIARRIVCYPEEGTKLVRGTRLGMIRFGSRVELYLPESTTIHIRQGESIKGGETIIGYVS